MRLRHATPARNLNSILRRGLLCSRSRGRLPVVWLHAPRRSAWPVLHTVRRHGGRAEAVVIIEVEAPRRWLRRSRKGLWCCTRDVLPDCFRGLLDLQQVACRCADGTRPARRPALAQGAQSLGGPPCRAYREGPGPDRSRSCRLL